MKHRLILILLFVTCCSLATYLQPRQLARAAAENQSGNVMTLLLGDGRKMFANEFYARADAYFHRGHGQSIFDTDAPKEEHHMTQEAGHAEHAHNDGDHEEHEEGPPPPRDWIEWFGRHIYPITHVHLE